MKVLKCLYIKDAQTNDLNFRKIELRQIAHVNGNTKISSDKTLVATELVDVILAFWGIFSYTTLPYLVSMLLLTNAKPC